jgi:hypothetical protein
MPDRRFQFTVTQAVFVESLEELMEVVTLYSKVTYRI